MSGKELSYDQNKAAMLMMKKEMQDDNNGGYRRTMSESVVGACSGGSAMSEDIGMSASVDDMNVFSDTELKLYRRAMSEDELICNCDDNRPKQLDLDVTEAYPSESLPQPLIVDSSMSTEYRNEPIWNYNR